MLAPASLRWRPARAERRGSRLRRAPLGVAAPLVLLMLLVLFVLFVLPMRPAHAGMARFCDESPAVDAVQQDRLLRVAAAMRAELERSGASMALVSRSGLRLDWLGHATSHAGLSLRDHALGRWTVRQLYFACDEGRPRLFDQGLSAFVTGLADADHGRFAVVLPGPEAAASLAGAALDDRRALQVLGPSYSANAHAFDDRHQNCNQWLAELMALAWGGLDGPQPRRQAQQWLRGQGYQPSTLELGSPPMVWIGRQLPWLHFDDHPAQDLAQARLQVSMPASLETFVRRRDPGAQRLEFCHDPQRLVVRRGWEPLDIGCNPQPGDEVVALVP